MTNYHLLILTFLLIIKTSLTIMVPTGKIGPITPKKIEPSSSAINTVNYRAPAAVWERVDEGPNPYQQPVYKYTLYNYVRKNIPRTLIPREDQYYMPRAGIQPVYHNKIKYYYSPLQFL